MPTSTPLLSVIVPAHQAAALLPTTLPALKASDLAPERWELIVVDDGSVDGTSMTAATWADRVVTLPGNARGPGGARNAGAEVANGAWLVFVDADVAVHRETLSLFADAAAQAPEMDAFFGTYCAAPTAPGFLSQYRNLLHRYVHISSAGETNSFWAGCGAVRRAAFIDVGGFDTARYPRPQIEDIDLGYRLHAGGYRIAIRPEIQATHLKRWAFWGAIKTDLLDRGIPWVRLLLERGRLTQPAGLNLKRGEAVKAALTGIGTLLAVGALLTQRLDLLVGAGLLFGVVLASNHALLRWFAQQRGVLFALGVAPFNLLYYLVAGLATGIGLAGHALAGRPHGNPEAASRKIPLPNLSTGSASEGRPSPEVTR